jgi:hypothetical protein
MRVSSTVRAIDTSKCLPDRCTKSEVRSYTGLIQGAERFVPKWLEDWMYPIDKTNLDVLRFTHFVALAVLTVRLVPQQWTFLHSIWLRPASST